MLRAGESFLVCLARLLLASLLCCVRCVCSVRPQPAAVGPEQAHQVGRLHRLRVCNLLECIGVVSRVDFTWLCSTYYGKMELEEAARQMHLAWRGSVLVAHSSSLCFLLFPRLILLPSRCAAQVRQAAQGDFVGLCRRPPRGTRSALALLCARWVAFSFTDSVCVLQAVRYGGFHEVLRFAQDLQKQKAREAEVGVLNRSSAQLLASYLVAAFSCDCRLTNRAWRFRAT